MKREIERSAVLQSISIDLAELSVLIDKLLTQFANPAKANVAISVQLNKEKVTAASVAELEEATDLPARVTEFSIAINEEILGPRRVVYVWSKTFASKTPRVTAIGESEAWAAGAIETTKVFFARHRRPFSWVSRIPMGMVAFTATLLLLWAGAQTWKAGQPIPWSWVAGYLALLSLDLVHVRVAECQLILRESESRLTRALPMLGLVVALASLGVAILAWLLPRTP
jgi:hypothetical protein